MAVCASHCSTNLPSSDKIQSVRTLRDIHIGPAGWSYADWRGRVYPESAGTKFDTLALVANYFDTAEINSSFYHPPSPSTARSWLQRIEHNPNFIFTAKFYKVFTHERGKATNEDEKAFREGVDPLAEAGKLGAVLMQFPWSFKNDREERGYLNQLVERFKDYPLVVELRHESWNNPRILQTLEDLSVGLCDIDQPLFANSIKPSAEVTSPIGYVRLHERRHDGTRVGQVRQCSSPPWPAPAALGARAWRSSEGGGYDRGLPRET